MLFFHDGSSSEASLKYFETISRQNVKMCAQESSLRKRNKRRSKSRSLNNDFYDLEFIKFYTYESILNLINSTRMVTIFPTKAHDGTESCIEYLEKRSTMHPHFYQKFAFV